MQLQSDKSHRFEDANGPKGKFRAREGYYRLMNFPDYSQRSQRAMGFSTGTTNSNSSTASNEKTCIKISLVTINDSDDSVIGFRQQPPDSHRSPNSNAPNNPSGRMHLRSRGAQDKKICFNVGRELFVYNYDGVRTGPDASNPIYKRSYKGSSPTCHDFNQTTATAGSISLLVGFSHGQVQLINLNGCDDQEACKEFNVDRLIDKTRVTCIKWLPNSPSLFLVAHASGQLYLYKDDLPCGPAAPTYQLYKQTDGVMVYTCKTKTTRNPIYRWSIGVQAPDAGASALLGSSNSLHNLENESCSLNEFSFSPCAKYLACVSQDGFLRVYCYDTMELVGRARSYYGGLTCVCWSPDGKYVVTGGEDDLITVWSFVERRVVARGTGHKSWVSVVAFDSFYTGYDLKDTDVDNDEDDEDEDKDVGDQDLEVDGEDDDEDELQSYGDVRVSRLKLGRLTKVEDYDDETLSLDNQLHTNQKSMQYSQRNTIAESQSTSSPTMTSYRFGSVGQDTQLCLWDLNDDLLKQPIAKSKVSSMTDAISTIILAGTSGQGHEREILDQHKLLEPTLQNELVESNAISVSADNESSKHKEMNGTTNSATGGFLTTKGSGFTKTFSLVGKRDKRNLSQRTSDKTLGFKNNTNVYNNDPKRLIEDPNKLLGSPICPRMNEVPLLEPTVCKKISYERLTSLVFCKGGFITSCQDGYVFSWARPSRRSYRVSPGQSNEELRVIDVGTSSVV